MGIWHSRQTDSLRGNQFYRRPERLHFFGPSLFRKSSLRQNAFRPLFRRGGQTRGRPEVQLPGKSNSKAGPHAERRPPSRGIRGTRYKETGKAAATKATAMSRRDAGATRAGTVRQTRSERQIPHPECKTVPSSVGQAEWQRQGATTTGPCPRPSIS